MKLLHRLFLLAGPLLALALLVGGFGSFHYLRGLADEEAREGLQLRQREIEADFPTWLARWGDQASREGQLLLLQPDAPGREPQFSDTLLQPAFEDDVVPFMQLGFELRHADQRWWVTVRKARIESDDLVESLLKAQALVLALLLLSAIALSHFSHRVLWRPFQLLLARIAAFDFRDQHPFDPVATGTREFDELGAHVRRMTEKLQRDYQSLRQFSEDASHEMQTPVSAIVTHLELLMQQDDLSQDSRGHLQHAYAAANRLARLQHTLALLTRVDNQEFRPSAPIELGPWLQEKLDSLEDLIDSKRLQLQVEISPCLLRIHPDLCDTLFSNLLHNAIRHSLPGGSILLTLNAHSLQLENTGMPFAGDPATLFERFRKADPTSGSLGLGLALVQRICQHAGIGLDYTITGDRHRFQLDFPASR
ncbi:MAG: HAMP domain-containing histidine kinase [Candidatus Delongbacteria bacterium]|nr:HAMP domain-containing histidine kinase [Candidatus Cloacimonadota bacterium]MCB9473887.1 HAMP domain-containing histidine kinase [Candidatus Delongbacteria bacterium]